MTWDFETTDRELLSDPERMPGFGAPGTPLDGLYRWFSIWLRWN